MGSTAAEREKDYTTRQIRAVKAARDLSRRLAYPSIKNLKEAIRNGGILNSGITVRDVDRAEAIWGPALAVIKGRSTGHVSPMESERAQQTEQDEALRTDIMFVNGYAFLVSVCKPQQYVLIDRVRSKSSEHLRAGLTSQISRMKGHGVTVKEIRSDPESGVESVIEWKKAQKVIPEILEAGEMVQAAERAIKQIKERMRCVLSGLRFVMPKSWTPFLAEYCVQRVNMMRSSVSPVETCEGR
ncbi:hypothetical protein FVE85_7696 [Porphyridium purpureum]|uniref:Uncharacterized protein n=1 Tax=Porphyridium purpureum TaxID=35688 RepID=A0A5J4YJF5_PORPP|nr:hypothetical protein FVE85_7696 [Porphyridium purpureum]|eukprot:POR4182..scf210_14